MGEGSHVCRRRSRRGRCASPPRPRTTPSRRPVRDDPGAARPGPARRGRRPGRAARGASQDSDLEPRADRRPDPAPESRPRRAGQRRAPSSSTWTSPPTRTRSSCSSATASTPGTCRSTRVGVRAPSSRGRRPATSRSTSSPSRRPAPPDARRPPRPRPARQRRRGRRARTRLQLRRAGPAREGRREDGGARQAGPGPPDRRRRLQLEALRDPRRAAPADRPARAGAAVHPRHLLLDRRRVRRARRGRERPRLPAYGDLGVRRRHRLRPQDPQRRPEAERRGPAEAAADPPPEAEFVIDIVTHSRGGLVTRSFVEQVLPPQRLAGDRRQHRLRRLDQRRHPSGRPGALVGPGRHLHQPRRGLREGAHAGRAPPRRRGRRWRGQGDRGLREVPRLLRRRGRRRPRPQGDGARRRVRHRAQQDPARPAGAGHELVRGVLQLPRQPLRRPATTRRSSPRSSRSSSRRASSTSSSRATTTSSSTSTRCPRSACPEGGSSATPSRSARTTSSTTTTTSPSSR